MDWIEERIPRGQLYRLPEICCSAAAAAAAYLGGSLRRNCDEFLRDSTGFCFCGMQGYPVNKVEIARETVVRLHSGQTTIVGDNDSDEAAALVAGIQFLRAHDLGDLWKFDRKLQP